MLPLRPKVRLVSLPAPSKVLTTSPQPTNWKDAVDYIIDIYTDTHNQLNEGDRNESLLESFDEGRVLLEDILALPIFSRLFLQTLISDETIAASDHLPRPLKVPSLQADILQHVFHQLLQQSCQMWSPAKTVPDPKFVGLRSVLSVCKLWRQAYFTGGASMWKGIYLNIAVAYYTPSIVKTSLSLGFTGLQTLRLKSTFGQVWPKGEVLALFQLIPTVLPNLTSLDLPGQFLKATCCVSAVQCLLKLPQLTELNCTHSGDRANQTDFLYALTCNAELMSRLQVITTGNNYLPERKYGTLVTNFPTNRIKYLSCSDPAFWLPAVECSPSSLTTLRIDGTSYNDYAKLFALCTELTTLAIGYNLMLVIQKQYSNSFFTGLSKVKTLELGFLKEESERWAYASTSPLPHLPLLLLSHIAQYLPVLNQLYLTGCTTDPSEEGQLAPFKALQKVAIRAQRTMTLEQLQSVFHTLRKHSSAFPALTTVAALDGEVTLAREVSLLIFPLPIAIPSLRRFEISSDDTSYNDFAHKFASKKGTIDALPDGFEFYFCSSFLIPPKS